MGCEAVRVRTAGGRLQLGGWHLTGTWLGPQKRPGCPDSQPPLPYTTHHEVMHWLCQGPSRKLQVPHSLSVRDFSVHFLWNHAWKCYTQIQCGYVISSTFICQIYFRWGLNLFDLATKMRCITVVPEALLIPWRFLNLPEHNAVQWK